MPLKLQRVFCPKCCCGHSSGVISNIVFKLEKPESTTAVQGNKGPPAQFSKFCFPKSHARQFHKANHGWYMASPGLTLGPQEAPKAPKCNVLKRIPEKINKIAIQKLIRGCIRPSIYQSVSFAKRTKQHASRKSKFRNASRYHERARRGQNRK